MERRMVNANSITRNILNFLGKLSCVYISSHDNKKGHKKNILHRGKSITYPSHRLLKKSSGVNFLPLAHGDCTTLYKYNHETIPQKFISNANCYPWVPMNLTIQQQTCYVPIPLRFARFSMAPVGSEPMERKQMSGVLGSLSSHVASKLRMTPSAYLSPMVSAMYLRAWCSVRSGHHDLHRTIILD